MRAPSLKGIISALFFLLLTGFQARAQEPVLTVRFANPEYVCATQTYNLDVELMSDINGVQLFGMNVRFFYAENILEFISFGEYASGYAAVAPDPAFVFTGGPTSGMTNFGFAGPQEYVNGAIQLITGSTVVLSSTSWTKIFNVNFHVDDPSYIDTNNFCPSVIWDLKENPNDGGIGAGLIMTVVSGSGSASAIEHCVQFNWQYDGVPGLPYGNPVCLTSISTLSSYAPKSFLPGCGFNTPGLISVPVTVQNFNSIKVFSVVFKYDPLVMTYSGNTPNPIFNAQNGLLTVTDANASGGFRKITMTFQGNNAISLADNSSLAAIRFNYIAGTSSMTFRTGTGGCYFKGANNETKCDQPYADFYHDGEVVTLQSPVTKIDSSLAVVGNLVTFPVRVWDFEDINSGLLTLNYDPDVLTYHDVAPDPAISEVFMASEIIPGILEMSWLGNDTSLADNSILALITFEYLGGSSTLLWFDDGISCQYTRGCFYLPVIDTPIDTYFKFGNVTNSAFLWEGENSGDWNTDSNWMSDNTPNQFTDVVIDPSANPENWPVFNGDLTLGEDCRDLTLNGNARLTVNGNLTIYPGRTLNLSGNGTLEVTGNWISSGNFNSGNGTVEFTGSGNTTIDEGVPAGNYISGYDYSTFTVGMTPLTGGNAGPTGNDAHSDVNIGFNFNFLGVNYSQVRINTNGWVSLNLSGDDATSGDNFRLFNTSNPATVLAPWWDDLLADGTSSIKYTTEGSAPSRVFTVEWKDILAFNVGCTARLNFQLKLYETTNTIEFCYGTATTGTRQASEGASIGIKDATGGTGNFLEATQNSTFLILATLKSNVSWPSANYRFSPPVPSDMESFYKIIVSKSSGNLQVQRDVHVTGVE